MFYTMKKRPSLPERKLMAKPLQVNAERVRKDRYSGILEAVA